MRHTERLASWLTEITYEELRELFRSLIELDEKNAALIYTPDDPEKLTILGHFLERAEMIVNAAVVDAICAERKSEVEQA